MGLNRLPHQQPPTNLEPHQSHQGAPSRLGDDDDTDDDNDDGGDDDDDAGADDDGAANMDKG